VCSSDLLAGLLSERGVRLRALGADAAQLETVFVDLVKRAAEEREGSPERGFAAAGSNSGGHG